MRTLRNPRHDRWRLRWIVLLSSLLLPGLAEAQGVAQLTDFMSAKQGLGAMDDAGTTIFVNSSTNQFGANGEHIFQVFKFDAISGLGEQVTNFDVGVTEWIHGLSVSDDGLWVAFISAGNHTGQNLDASRELFVMAHGGTQITQLTSDTSVLAGSVSFFKIAGDGNSLVFVSTSDLTGDNPSGSGQIYKVGRDGSGLSQVTSSFLGNFWDLDVSDDGQRIVFAADGDPTGGNADGMAEVFAVEASGSNLRQLTSDPVEHSLRSVIAGDGSVIAFESDANWLGGNPDGRTEIFAIDWDGTGLRQVTRAGTSFAAFPSIIDDGSWVVFYSNQTVGEMNPDRSSEIWKVVADGSGSGLGLITDFVNTPALLFPRVSGSGSRVTFVTAGGEIPGGDNSDGNWELHACNFNGAGLRQLTFTTEIEVSEPNISPDGSRVIFVSDGNIFGNNPYAHDQIYRIERDGSDLTQLTDLNRWIRSPTISADNATIVFVHNGNPLGTNPDYGMDVFKISADGGGLTQLTFGGGADSIPYFGGPQLSAEGETVVFAGDGNYTGGNADGSYEVFKIQTDGSGLVQLTTGTTDVYSLEPRVSADGGWAVFWSNGDFSGQNPDGSYEVFRTRTNGAGLPQQVSAGHDSFDPPEADLSVNGEMIVYSSPSDPLGTNPEGNQELFLYRATTGTTEQLTSFTEGYSRTPRISRDGSFLFFVSNAPVFEDDPDEPIDLYGVFVATGEVIRVGAERGTANAFDVTLSHLSTDASGVRAVFTGRGDFVRENPDASPEVWFIDRAAELTIEPSGPAPTTLTWDYESGPVRYDVIRGNIAEISAGETTIDLGPTVCIENDSPDATSEGSEDMDDPVPGEVFFYIYRGSQGQAAGPGNWGTASDGRERSANGCQA